MEERLRFTGDNPPVHLWTRFPNWQNAYEEEDLPGQDETTLRPADNQQTIDDDVTFTAGDAVLANGDSVPAMLGVLLGELCSVCIYPDLSENMCWALQFHVPSKRWVAMNDDWFLQADGIMPVPVGNPAVFPLRVTSRLPLQPTGETIAIEIDDPHEQR